MPLLLNWADEDSASIIFSLVGEISVKDYGEALGTLQQMSQERQNVALIIHYSSDYIVNMNGFAESAKHFYQFMHNLNVWQVLVATKSADIIILWTSTLDLYKIEPPTYCFANTIEEAIEQIAAKRAD